MPNQLNIISPSIRDFLLGKNLKLSESIEKYGNPSWGNGVGLPAQIQLESDEVKDSFDIVEIGELYREELLNINRFKNESSKDEEFSVLDISDSEYYKNKKGDYDEGDSELDSKSSKSNESRYRILNKNKYLNLQEITRFNVDDSNLQNYDGANESYIDKNGDLNVGGPSTNAANIIGSIITGRGVGFSPNGVEPNFDLRSSLAGRTLGAAGVINDTPLGQIGATQLAFAMLNNVAFNAQQETLGHINTSVINYLSGGDILVPDYDITVPKGGKRALDIIQKLSGFEVPTSLMSTSSDIFSFDSKLKLIRDYQSKGQSLFDPKNYNSQSLVNDTGKGQRNMLFQNLNANLLLGWYAPTYEYGKDGVVGVQYENQSSNYNGLNDVASPGNYTEFTWASDSESYGNFEVSFKTKKSLLSKTQDLFKNKKIRTMVSAHGKSEVKNDEINSSVTDNGLMSKGNAVLGSDGKTFCRTWTSLDRYDTLNDLQKHRGLYGSEAGVRLSDTNLSVLDDNGFVRIGPTKKANEVSASEIKRFMFSIENLAWMDETANLRPCEIGPGDGIDYDGQKRQGRIMWFPPYNLSFTDTSSVNWGSTEFIGRGEPIYTYNNTERSGTLTFKIITDHASSYNDFKKSEYSKDLINRIIFGCEDLPAVVEKNISVNDKVAIEVAKKEKEPEPTIVTDNTFIDKNVTFYFPNDISDVVWSINQGYEYSGTGIGEYQGEYNRKWKNLTNNYLNVDFIDTIEDIMNLAKDNKTTKIEILGYASSHGYLKNNLELSTNRANNLKQYLIDTYGIEETKFKITIGKGENTVSVKSQDAEEAKKARYSIVRVYTDPESNTVVKPVEPIKKIEEDDTDKVTESIINNFYSECSYFDYINEQSELVYSNISNSIKEQIRYFQPAFHSITPEGLNSRLTFLLQCTRQGPTLTDKVTPSNLAFGRPPVCILRIGDFYHTKIIIDNVDFQFNEVQWDLNPEGIGVQPMIVDVTISFKFIGGSSLSGPIAKLQNAVSFNFFANTEMYDDRADRIEGGKMVSGKWKENEKLKEDNTESTSKKEVEVNQTNSNETENSGVQTMSDGDSGVLSRLIFSVVTKYEDGLLYVKLKTAQKSDGTGQFEYTDKNYNGKVYIWSSSDNGSSLPETLLTEEQSLFDNAKIILQSPYQVTEDYISDISLTSGITYGIRVEWDDALSTKNKFNLKVN